MKIGIGITTFKRPKNLELILENLSTLDRDRFFVVIAQDGNDHYPTFPDVEFIPSTQQKGVAHTKNKCLTRMIEENCDYYFLLDDDVLPNAEVFDYFIETSKITGIEHLQFGDIDGNKLITSVVYDETGRGLHIRPHCKGAFLFITKNLLNKIGLWDEGFTNALEHVDFTYRCMKEEGLPFWYFVEPINSKKYITNIEGESTITDKEKYQENKNKSFVHWYEKYKFNMVDIPYLPLSNTVEVLKRKKP